MKTCSKCLISKTIDEFYRRTGRSGAALLKSWCKACTNEAHQSWVHKSYVGAITIPEKPLACGLCQEVGKMCLDHDHATGKFRGWLCDRCNRSLGLLKDDPKLLRAAADYIERAK